MTKNLDMFDLDWTIPAVLLIVIAALVVPGPHPLIAIYALVILVIGILSLWRTGESPILAFVFSFQWLQGSVLVFYANLKGVPLDSISVIQGSIQEAILLTLTSLLVLALGLRFGVGAQTESTSVATRNLAQSFSIQSWLNWYIFSLLVTTSAELAAREFPSLSQPLLALSNLKWAAFYLLTVVVFSRPKGGRIAWLLIFTLQFAAGLGFFAEFRTVIIVALLGFASTKIRLRPPQMVILGGVGICTIAIGIVWTAVKGDFRNFVSGGEQVQAVVVDYGERSSHLVNLVLDLDKTQFSQAADEMVRRLSYVEYFAATLQHVPEVVPYTGGTIWLDALTRPFLPRAFFPDKTEIHDSERTMEYTGITVASVAEGTSISIGYIGESYIDFGRTGMLMVIFVYGVTLGGIYRWLVSSGPTYGLLGMSIATSLLISTTFLETSITKVIGGLAASLLIVWLLRSFVIGRYLRFLIPMPTSNSMSTIRDAN